MSLPTQREFSTLQKIQQQQDGKNPYLNVEDAEICVEKGWADCLSPNRYQLTNTGASFLN